MRCSRPLRLDGVEEWQREGERHYAALVDFARGLIGRSKAEAARLCEELGLTVRMVDWDLIKGPVALTQEYREDRVTVFVKNGVVTETEPG